MPYRILPYSSAFLMPEIGRIRRIMTYGNPTRPFTTHVLRDGVFRMEAETVSGQKHWARPMHVISHVIRPCPDWIFPELWEIPIPSGILLQMVVTLMDVQFLMSDIPAAAGHARKSLMEKGHATSVSPTQVVSCQTIPLYEHTDYLSDAGKNKLSHMTRGWLNQSPSVSYRSLICPKP